MKKIKTAKSKSKTSRSKTTSTTSKRKVKQLDRGLVNTKITKGKDGEYHVEGFILNQSIVKVKNKKPLVNYNDAVFISDVTKDAIVSTFNKELNKGQPLGALKKNPSHRSYLRNPIDQQNDQGKFGVATFESATQAAIGIPPNPADAMELGRMNGLKDALENYCPVPFYMRKAYKRKQEMLATINDIVTNGFYLMSKRLVMGRENYNRYLPQPPKSQLQKLQKSTQQNDRPIRI